MTTILRQLGFKSKVVHSLNVKLANGKKTSHAWVEVSIDHEKRFYCPVFPDPHKGTPTFAVMGRAYNYNSFFRLLAGWGAIGINAIKYYFIGDAV